MAWWNSIETVQYWNSLLGGLVALAGAITGLAGVATLVLGFRISALEEIQSKKDAFALKELEGQVATANREAAIANKDVAKANVRAEELSKEVALANERVAIATERAAKAETEALAARKRAETIPPLIAVLKPREGAQYRFSDELEDRLKEIRTHAVALVALGSNIAYANSLPHVVIKQSNEDLLTVGMNDKNEMWVSGTFCDERGEAICVIEKNQLTRKFDNALELLTQADDHAIAIVRNPGQREIFRLESLDQKTFRVTGTFFLRGGLPLELTENEGRIGGMPTTGNIAPSLLDIGELPKRFPRIQRLPIQLTDKARAFGHRAWLAPERASLTALEAGGKVTCKIDLKNFGTKNISVLCTKSFSGMFQKEDAYKAMEAIDLQEFPEIEQKVDIAPEGTHSIEIRVAHEIREQGIQVLNKGEMVMAAYVCVSYADSTGADCRTWFCYEYDPSNPTSAILNSKFNGMY